MEQRLLCVVYEVPLYEKMAFFYVDVNNFSFFIIRCFKFKSLTIQQNYGLYRKITTV